MKHILSACLWTFVWSLLAACSKDAAPVKASTVEPNEPPAEPAPPPANEIDLMSLLGAQIKLAEGLPANEFRGDFNADDVPDRAYLVASSSFPPNLAPDVQVWRPFPTYAPTGQTDVKQGSPVSLVLVNGGPTFPIATIVLHDDQMEGPLAVAAREGIRLVKQVDLAATPIVAVAKGDALMLAGKAGVGYVYWDGTAFQFLASAQKPQ